MRYLRIALLPLLLVACTDRGPVAPDVVPSFDFANAPAVSGVVVRGSGEELGLLALDEKTGLMAFIGVDIVTTCAGGDAALGLIHWQRHEAPTNPERIHSVYAGTDVPVTVWPAFGLDCARLTTETPLGVGTVRVHGTDNDELRWLYPDQNNVNAFGFFAKGEVELTAGGSARLDAGYRIVWDGYEFISNHQWVRLK